MAFRVLLKIVYLLTCRVLGLAADGEGLVQGPMKAMSGGEVAAKDVVIPDITGERCPFIAEALYNGHNLFVMVTGKKAARFGRRVRVAAS